MVFLGWIAGFMIKTADLTKFLVQLAALLCAALLFIRIKNSLSYAAPLQVIVTDGEAESLFSIWKWITGDTVYSSSSDIPFAKSHYNWFFYAAYAAISSCCMHFWNLGIDWLPTIGHTVTVALNLLLLLLFIAAARELQFWPTAWGKVTVLAYAVLSVFNPLFGWNSITVRPDVGAVFFEPIVEGRC